MLNFDEFQEYAKMKIPELIAEKGEQVEVMLNHVTKNNGVILHAATVKTEDSCIAPNIYLDGAFKQYEEGADLDELMDKLAETAFSNLKAPEELATVGKDYQNFDFVKDKIIMTVVNAEKNRELLADVPHENREDLAMIYKVMLSKSSQGLATITIRNEHMKAWGVTEAEIHELAMKNTREILPVTVQSMGEVLGEFAGEAGIPEDMNRSLFADMPLDEQMFIISNASKVNGAASIFYEDALSDLADKIGQIFIFFPHPCMSALLFPLIWEHRKCSQKWCGKLTDPRWRNRNSFRIMCTVLMQRQGNCHWRIPPWKKSWLRCPRIPGHMKLHRRQENPPVRITTDKINSKKGERLCRYQRYD